jgi:hypothetical protein
MTEAACLLQSGALYPLRLGLRPESGDDVFLGVKPGAFSLYQGDAPYYHFDLDGRWQRAFVAGVHYLKGLDTAVHAIDRVRHGENMVLERRALSFAETTDLDAEIRSTAIGLLDGLDSSLSVLHAPGGTETLTIDQTRDLLELVARWDAAAWFAHRERYLGTYGPLPFLPPETSNPVILQATLGQSRGLAFGGEPGATYYERSPAEFKEHTATVARLLGRRTLQCRQLFLAGPDALRRPVERIVSDLDAAGAVFPIVGERPRIRARDVDVLDDTPCLEGVHTFLHEFDRPPFTPEAWHELEARHLKRLILGVESGSAEVRSRYGRDWSNDALREWVDTCPVGLGMVVVVGAGGIEAAEDHVEATVQTIGSLSLPPGTLVSLVDADDLDPRPAADRGFEPLDPASLTAQRAELKARLTDLLRPGKVKVTTYSTEKRWQ